MDGGGGGALLLLAELERVGLLLEVSQLCEEAGELVLVPERDERETELDDDELLDGEKVEGGELGPLDDDDGLEGLVGRVELGDLAPVVAATADVVRFGDEEDDDRVGGSKIRVL